MTFAFMVPLCAQAVGERGLTGVPAKKHLKKRLQRHGSGQRHNFLIKHKKYNVTALTGS
jgi:hypothetical protein